jgi:hypothetical protein
MLLLFEKHVKRQESFWSPYICSLPTSAGLRPETRTPTHARARTHTLPSVAGTRPSISSPCYNISLARQRTGLPRGLVRSRTRRTTRCVHAAHCSRLAGARKHLQSIPDPTASCRALGQVYSYAMRTPLDGSNFDEATTPTLPRSLTRFVRPEATTALSRH